MLRFETIKPEVQQVIQQREVSKEALRHVFFYSLLELERLRSHVKDLESEIDDERDLYLLLDLGSRKEHTGESIAYRKELTRSMLPVILKQILDAYLRHDEADRWDRFILYSEHEIERYLSGEIDYDELVKRTIFQCDPGDEGIVRISPVG